MDYTRIGIIFGGITLTACPQPTASTTDSDVDSAGSTTEQAASGSSSEASAATETATTPTTGATATTTPDPTTTGTDSDTDSESTGTPSDVGPARIYYIADAAEAGEPAQLLVVSIEGGQATAPGNVISFAPDWTLPDHAVTKDRNTLALAVNFEASQAAELFLIDTPTAEVTQIGLPASAATISRLAFSPDEARVVFMAGDEGLDVYVCEVKPGDCEPGIMNPAFPPMAGTGLYSNPTLSPQNTWLVYGADVDGDNGVEVMLGRTDMPGQATEVASFPNNWSALTSIGFSDDETILYFGVDDADPFRIDYYGVDLTQDPLEPVLLHPPMATDVRGSFAQDRGSLLLWSGTAGFGDLWQVPLDGLIAGEPVLLNTTGPGQVATNQWGRSLDGKHVAFLSQHETPGLRELYVVDSDAAAAPIKVSPALDGNDGVVRFEWTADSSRLLSTAVLSETDPEQLFLTDLAAPNQPMQVNGTLPDGGELYGYVWSDDQKRLMYLVNQPSAGVRDAFVVDLDGASPTEPVQVNPPLAAGDLVSAPVLFASDGQRAIYKVSADGGPMALHTVALPQGGAPEAAVQLSLPGEGVKTVWVFPPAP